MYFRFTTFKIKYFTRSETNISFLYIYTYNLLTISDIYLPVTFHSEAKNLRRNVS